MLQPFIFSWYFVYVLISVNLVEQRLPDKSAISLIYGFVILFCELVIFFVDLCLAFSMFSLCTPPSCSSNESNIKDKHKQSLYNPKPDTMGSFASRGRRNNQVIQVTQIHETRLEVRGQHINPSPKHTTNNRRVDYNSDTEEGYNNYTNNISYSEGKWLTLNSYKQYIPTNH